MAVGNRDLIRALLKIKQNTDSGPFGAIQDAAVYALRSGGKLAEANRRMYQRRRDAFCDELGRLGWDIPRPQATFYVWARVPTGCDRVTGGESVSLSFTKKMLANCGVMCAPGVGFGQAGEGYVRFALVAEESKLRVAAKRIGTWLQ
jgi:LL-diaminopimelate aminotransferase